MVDEMKEICGHCGMRYGLHIGWACPGHKKSFFRPTGEYEEEIIERNLYCAHSRVILKPIGTGGGAMKDTWQCEICGAYFIPDIKQPEKKMSDKIQMTEEQAVLILRCATYNLFDTESERKEEINSMIISLKNNGYIIKSELQQKVEEALDIVIDLITMSENGFFTVKYGKIKRCIESLCESHPEFKEK